MKSSNDNNSFKSSKKFHNPKAHAPALYVSCWLSQVSDKLLTPGAKILYGRLAQWSNETGTVYRSSSQLAEELGSSLRTIERRIKELKVVGLIGTYHPQAGGVNHFEFYDHPWMHEPIKEQLVYKSTYSDPPPTVAVPPANCGGTPPPYVADINKNKIEKIINTKNISTSAKCVSPNKEIFGLKEMLADNPFLIPLLLIQDWMKVRAKKRAAITRTAWDQLNKKLGIIQETTSCTAVEAFTRMVSKGWLSVEPEWFNQTTQSKSNGRDALSRVINKHLNNQGVIYDHATSSAINPLR